MESEQSKYAREVAERFGKVETTVNIHDKHLIEINGSIRESANSIGRLVTEMAIQSSDYEDSRDTTA